MAHTIADAEAVGETDEAICVYAPLFDEDVWVPRSQIDDDSEVWEKGHMGDLIVSEWFAEKRGWL